MRRAPTVTQFPECTRSQSRTHRRICDRSRRAPAGGSNFAANPPGGSAGRFGRRGFRRRHAGRRARKSCSMWGDMGRTSADRSHCRKAAPAAGPAVSSWGSATRAVARAGSTQAGRRRARGELGAGAGGGTGGGASVSPGGGGGTFASGGNGGGGAAYSGRASGDDGYFGRFPRSELAGYFRTAAMGAPLAA